MTDASPIARNAPDCARVAHVKREISASKPVSRRGCRPGQAAPLYLNKIHPAEYRAWSGMRTRCHNPNFKDFALYGGRGIAVCKRWDSFACFLGDMGPKPSAHLTLDRINGDGDYTPANCRWATPKEQARNWRTRNRRLTLHGQTMTISAWAERLGWRRETIKDRLASGWSVERALTTPLIKHRERRADGTFAPSCN